MKISILGFSCSGKSTFSNEIAKKLYIKVYHLDSYYWKDTWKKNELFDISSFIEEDNWIIEGNYLKHSLEERLNSSDYIIYIDCNLVIRLFRMIKRHILFIINPNGKTPISNKINLKFILITIYKSIFFQPKLIRYLKSNYSQKYLYIKNIKEINDYDQFISKLFNTQK